MEDTDEIPIFLTPEMIQAIKNHMIGRGMPTAAKAITWLAIMGDRFHEEILGLAHRWGKLGPAERALVVQDGTEVQEVANALVAFGHINKKDVMLKRLKGMEVVNVTLNKADYEMFKNKSEKISKDMAVFASARAYLDGEAADALSDVLDTAMFVSSRVCVGLMFWEKYVDCLRSQDPDSCRAAEWARIHVMEPVEEDFKPHDSP